MTAPALIPLKTTVFEHFSSLARQHDAVNLGQGFPDFGWPEALLRVAADALLTGWNQYPPSPGVPELRAAVSAFYSRAGGPSITPEEVIVTAGASEALAAALIAVVEPGAEVVLVEPLYDLYAPMVRRLGGVPRFITPTPPDWRLTDAALAAAFSPRTRVMVINTPHNPTGVVLDRAALEMIGRFIAGTGAVLIADEVWETVTFDGRAHLSMLAIPELRDRTVKVGSAGKMFALTGWKVGWAVASAPLAARVQAAHQFLTFTVPPNLQRAAAAGLALPKAYHEGQRARLQAARDRLTAALTASGWAVLPATGTYFLLVDLAASGVTEPDRAFCERIVRDHGVAAIPLSAFYEIALVTSVIRLCFAKEDATLDRAAARLAGARG